MKEEIGRKTLPWGISVTSVEIRDVAIPVAPQDAMSRQALAEREKQARVILGSAELAIAGQFVEAANIYAHGNSFPEGQVFANANDGGNRRQPRAGRAVKRPRLRLV